MFLSDMSTSHIYLIYWNTKVKSCECYFVASVSVCDESIFHDRLARIADFILWQIKILYKYNLKEARIRSQPF